MKKIYISDILSHTFQGKSTGHYFAVARNYQEMFGSRVIVAGGPVYKTGFSDEELLLLPYNAGGGGFKSRLKTFANAIKLFRKAKGEIIVLQQCTTITTFLIIALFFYSKSRLYLIQYNREGFRTKIGRLFFYLAYHKIDGIICPNDMVGNAFSGLPYCVVPDYIYTGNDKKSSKLYEERIYDFCIVGRLAPEKGVVEVIRVLAGTQYRIVIAGKPQTPELANQIEEACKDSLNIKLNLGYISDEDYYYFLHNSKYAILNYSGEYSERSSGVVFDTLFNGVPVIGRRCKALQFIEDNSLGYIFDDINDIDLSKVMQKCFHEHSLNHIKDYCQMQKKYIEKLNNFMVE